MLAEAEGEEERVVGLGFPMLPRVCLPVVFALADEPRKPCAPSVLAASGLKSSFSSDQPLSFAPGCWGWRRSRKLYLLAFLAIGVDEEEGERWGEPRGSRGGVRATSE